MMLCVHGSPLYQWDINRQLLIDSADLGSDFVIHCCYTEDSNALVVEPIIDGDKVLVNIPNILLQRFGHLRVYVVVEGDTIYDKTFYVMARPKPDDYVYTETEVLSYKSLAKRMDDFEKNGVSEEKIAKAVSDYLDENPITETDPTVPEWAKRLKKPTYTADEVGAISQDDLQSAVNVALGQAKDSGVFDGKDGVDGRDGKDGIDGKDGYTPKKGVDYFDGKDGINGIDGKDGQDGEKGEKGDKGDKGDKGEQGVPGEKGEPGEKGVDGKNGTDGYTPKKGTDYFTESDKTELVNAVISALPTAEGASF